MLQTTPNNGANAEFPAALLSWASHREGGVRRAFVPSGRPTGDVVTTPVVERLSRWICDAADGRTPIRAVLLVGGPGNGKTDAVEQTVHALGTHVRSEAELVGRFRTQVESGGPAPRALVAEIGDLVGGSASELRIVQDASVSGGPATPPEAALVEDLALVANRPDTLYLGCVNRGIVADALARTRRENSDPASVQLLETISSAVSQGGLPAQCWPLADNPWLAVWPMDATSLFTAEAGRSPAAVVFERALDETSWSACDGCTSRQLCPFRANRDALTEPGRLDNLLALLRNYEVAAGTRWTFRDVLSLVPEILVGTDSDFVGDDGQRVSPCQWTDRQVAIATDGNPKSRRAARRATLRLGARLYQQAMFPAWPSLRELRSSVNDSSRDRDNTSPHRDAPRDVWNWLRGRQGTAGTRVRRVLEVSLTPLLDPALADPDQRLTPSCAVRDIDAAFSRRVSEGRSRVRALQDLGNVERAVLDVLAEAEDCLDRDFVSQRRLADARKAQAAIRQLACRFTKRAILVRRGYCRDHALLERYLGVSRDARKLRETRTTFADLLNRRRSFHAPLAQSLGQPQRETLRDAILVTAKVSTACVSLSELAARDGYAPTTTPFLLVRESAAEHAVALTFQLFKALERMRDGAYRGCLPQAITALMQSLESRVAGQRVRDLDTLLEDDVFIQLLGGGIQIRLVDASGTFEVTRPEVG